LGHDYSLRVDDVGPGLLRRSCKDLGSKKLLANEDNIKKKAGESEVKMKDEEGKRTSSVLTRASVKTS